MEALLEKYILLDSLIFKIVATPEKETALLAIPEICTEKIITLYYSSLFAGVIKKVLLKITLQSMISFLFLI